MSQAIDIEQLGEFAWAWTRDLNIHLSQTWSYTGDTGPRYRGLDPSVRQSVSAFVLRDVLSSDNPAVRMKVWNAVLRDIEGHTTDARLPHNAYAPAPQDGWRWDWSRFTSYLSNALAEEMEHYNKCQRLAMELAGEMQNSSP